MLDAFRRTLDDAAIVSDWLRQRPADPHDRDGWTRVHRAGGYGVGRMAERNGRPLVDAVEPGDRVIAVDGRPLHGAPPEAAWEALRGPAGTTRHLGIGRDGEALRIGAGTTAF